MNDIQPYQRSSTSWVLAHLIVTLSACALILIAGGWAPAFAG